MSVKEDELKEQVSDYLKGYPLGRDEDEVQDEFSEVPEETVSEALNTLVDDGTLLKTGDSYRWTG